ncbi:MAG: radical SAM protein [Ferruginibacter sp.]
MKCFLVMPPWSPMDVYTGEFSKTVSGVWPPIGHLCSLAATLKQKGNHVEIIDGAFVNYSKILQKISEDRPDFVGLYINAFLWNSASKLMEMIKSKHPDIYMAIGGPLPSAWKEKCFEESDYVDFVFFGEADYSVTELVDCLKHKQPVDKVRGIIYRNGSSIIKTPAALIIKDLDQLPLPSRELIDNHRYKPPLETYTKLPVTYIFSSRGCTNRCLYCYQISDKPGIRFRSSDNVLAEIEESVLKYKMKEVRFFDDNFAYDMDRVDRICDGLLKAKYKVSWYCSSRVDNVSLEMLKKMKAAGCWGVLYGAESGVQKNLVTLRKNATLEETAHAVALTRKAGMRPFTPFIFGIPGETYEDGLKSIEFACKIKPFSVNFHTLTPFPGTELFDNVEKYGKKEGDFKDFTFEKAVFVPHTMTKQEIVKLREIAFKKFFSRPSYILMRLLAIRSFTDIKILWSGFRAFVHMYLNKKSFHVD